MKYRLETQQVFGLIGSGVAYDDNAEWLEHNVKPRGLAAAKAKMEERHANSGFKPPVRVVSVDALGVRTEVCRIESPHKPQPMQATIPFSGFYQSHHDAEIDQAVESMFSDSETGCERNNGLESVLFDKCNFGAVHRAYAESYSEAFAREFNIQGLQFDRLDSPKEYNFDTDRIFVLVPIEEVARIFAATDRKQLVQLVAERFTSRSGFMSFYSADLEDWGPCEEWDANQVGTLLQAYADQQSLGEFSSSEECALMESARSNGHYESWIQEATDGIERLYKIHDYLEARAKREGSN